MNAKIFFKALSIKVKQNKAFTKKAAKSYVSLFLVLLLSVVSTLAWFTVREDAEINAKNLEFQSASSLRINKDKSVSNRIKIDDFVLDEASSVDGRNIYFPLGASFTEDTANMFFREGNRGDENKRYVYKDFELKGTSGNTPVYIKAYKITIKDGSTVHDTEVNGVYEDELVINYQNGVPISQTIPPDCPIRFAFIADSGKAPVVIDPSAMVIDYVENSNAVKLINDNGTPTTQKTATDSFASYYYGKTPLFVIPSGQNLPVTLVIWLEGSLGNCQKYIGKKISVDIDIESNFAEMEEITFVDDTKPDNDNAGSDGYHWVSNDNPIIACSYKDPFSDEGRWKTVIMSRVSNNSGNEGYYQWKASIPKKAVSDIAFFRLNKKGSKFNSGAAEPKGTIYNSWRTAGNITTLLGKAAIPNSWFRSGSPDLQTTRQMVDADGNKYNALVYTAIRGNGHSVTEDSDKRLSPCVGYWDYNGSTSSGGSTGGNTGGNTGGETGGSSTYKVGVSLNASGDKIWLYNNVVNGDELWFVTENGKAYQINTNGYGRFEGTFILDAGDSIVYFGLKNKGATKYYNTLYLSPAYKITRDYNVSFTVNNNDTISQS